MFNLWAASSFTSRNIDSAPLALALMPIHYWVAIRASQENWPKINEPFISAQRPLRRHSKLSEPPFNRPAAAPHALRIRALNVQREGTAFAVPKPGRFRVLTPE